MAFEDKMICFECAIAVNVALESGRSPLGEGERVAV